SFDDLLQDRIHLGSNPSYFIDQYQFGNNSAVEALLSLCCSAIQCVVDQIAVLRKRPCALAATCASRRISSPCSIGAPRARAFGQGQSGARVTGMQALAEPPRH